MRRQVVEIECDRCARVERVPVVVGVDLATEGEDWTALTVALKVDGKLEVQFSLRTLCTPCTKTVKNHLEAIRKPIKGASPNRRVQQLGQAPIPRIDPGAKKKAQGHP